MPDQTAHLGLPFPLAGDDPDVHGDLAALATKLSQVVQLYGTLAARPAASAALNGAVYLTTDAPLRIYQCRAGAWVQVAVYDADFDSLAAAATATGGVLEQLILRGASPVLELRDNDQPANEGRFWAYIHAGLAKLGVRNDDGSAKVDAMTVAMTTGLVDFALAPTVGGRALHIADTYANRPAAAAALNGLRFFATDKLMEWQCVAGAWVLVMAYAPEVVALPGGAIDGQECKYRVSDSVMWHFRYRSATGRWMLVGGPPLIDTVAPEENSSAGGNVYQDLTTVGPTVTAPLAGSYRIQVGAEVWVATGLANPMAVFMSYSIAGAAASDADGFRVDWSNAGDGGRMCPSSHPLAKAVAAGNTIRAKYRDGSANHLATFGKRWLKAIPEYVT